MIVLTIFSSSDENNVLKPTYVFRFFPDGIVSMVTTADEPHVVVSQLRTRDVRNPQVSFNIPIQLDFLKYCILSNSWVVILDAVCCSWAFQILIRSFIVEDKIAQVATC